MGRNTNNTKNTTKNRESDRTFVAANSAFKDVGITFDRESNKLVWDYRLCKKQTMKRPHNYPPT
jgi:hypothetical protein